MNHAKKFAEQFRLLSYATIFLLDTVILSRLTTAIRFYSSRILAGATSTSVFTTPMWIVTRHFFIPRDFFHPDSAIL